MSESYYEYRVRCTTDNKYETWVLSENDPEPTTCPTNTSHTIDQSQTTIIKEISDTEVSIKEENVKTGGNFQSTTIEFDAIKNQESSQSISWPFPVSALAVQFVTEEINRGDILDMIIGKDTITGIVTTNVVPASTWSDQNYTSGQTVIYNSKVYTCILDTVSNEIPTDVIYWKYGLELSVSQTVIDYIRLGYYVKLFDEVNQDDVGRIIYIDNITNKIYAEVDVVNSFLATSPTYIQQSIKNISNYEIAGPSHNIIGSTKIGGAYIPANVTVTVCYTNKSTDTDKHIVGQVEFLY
jgi:hypothetical protein